ncbi:sulfurtransferase [Oceanobacter mangrovi]|uniref:sulfurtransferase n=1 Tax=Oceanobacter mangrovi TaxID=2862510 RepID=UPI001C8E121F|nr:sulfurtransferase [Oceanobacter mangrovi]
MQSPLVSTAWLAANLQNDKLILLDASMATVIGKEPIVYDSPCYIPGSHKCDLETVLIYPSSSQPHTFPTAAIFAAAVQPLGIQADSVVVIYDNQGVYSSPRAWWIFRTMGIEQVYVLDGGLPKWLAENRHVVVDLDDAATTSESDLAVNYNDRQVCSCNQLLEQLNDPTITVLDARAQARYLGQVAEPRPGVRAGHIPGSLNLPFLHVLDGDCFKSETQLQQLFAEIVTQPEQRLVFSCGSGITACIILLAAVIAGYNNVALYDGSWAEWGSNPQLPIE